MGPNDDHSEHAVWHEAPRAAAGPDDAGVSPLRWRATPLGGAVVVELVGELRAATCPELGRLLSALGHAVSPDLAIDLSRVTLVDPSALDVLARTRRQLRRHGGNLAVAHAPPALAGMIDDHDVGDAVATLPGSPRGWWGSLLDDFAVMNQAAGVLAGRDLTTPAAALARIERQAAAEGVTAAELARTIVAPPPVRVHVLYIEDNPVNVMVMRGFCARHPDVDLDVAGTGTAGVFLARQLLPDVLIVDLDLPDIDGEEVIRVLGADRSTANIPAIVLTADTSRAEADTRLSGAFAHLTKPFHFPDLEDAIDRARRPAPPHELIGP